MKIRYQSISIQDVRALRDALAHDPDLNVAEWARANQVHPRTIENYAYNGALTPAAQSRLDVADGKASRLRKVGADDLRALRDALARNQELNLAAWARVNRLHPRTVESQVHKGVLTPEAQNRLNLAEGKAPTLRKVEIDDLRALSVALTDNPKLDAAAWARVRGLNSETVRKFVREGALAPEIQNRLDVADGKAPSLKKLEMDDLRALSDALARNAELSVSEWARAHRLHYKPVRNAVRDGALTPAAQKRLQRADDRAKKLLNRR
ncbi:hypothetical protein [Pandoraea pulmonicola]|nr:hypothetical protein [Pandoraea pulmonicola]AJC22578.1 hypothetical protein RO07_22700 [Pandoraea pulmonicola]